MTTIYNLNGRLLQLELATTWRQRMRGLACRERLDNCHGMLFRFLIPWRWPIWMRGMRFPLYAIWLRRGRIVDAQVLPLGSWRWYRPRVSADMLIELPMNIRMLTGGLNVRP